MANKKIVSLLKETNPNELRVILLPDQISRFRREGFEVWVEKGAGEGVGVRDRAYKDAGGRIVDTERCWSSPFVLKYKAPNKKEYKYLRQGLHLGAIFHAEGDKSLMKELCRSGVTAYSYEFFRAPDGIFPMSVASSEIAGKLGVLHAAYYLQSHLGGRGILLADVIGVKRPKVLVIGYGNAGGAAARLALAMGADVTVLGTNPERLRQFQASLPSTATCLLNDNEVLEREVREADVVIGAILISNYDTPPMLTDRMVRKMKPGSVIIDITSGYGDGYMPTFMTKSNFRNPSFVRHGVIHCNIDTLPAAVPLTTVQAVSGLVGPYLVSLGTSIFEPTSVDPTSMAGKIVEDGQLLHPELIKNMKFLTH